MNISLPRQQIDADDGLERSDEGAADNALVFRPPPEMLLAHPVITRGSNSSCRPLDPSEEDLSSGEVLSEEWNGTFPAPAQPPSPTHVFRDDVRGGSSTPNLRRASSLGPSPWSDSPDLAGVFRERAGDGPTLHPGNPIRSNPSTTENSTVSAASSFGSLASMSPKRPSSFSDLKSVHIDLGDTPLASGSLVGDGPDPLLTPQNCNEEDQLRAATVTAAPLDDGDDNVTDDDLSDDFIMDISKGLFREEKLLMTAVFCTGTALGVYLWNKNWA